MILYFTAESRLVQFKSVENGLGEVREWNPFFFQNLLKFDHYMQFPKSSGQPFTDIRIESGTNVIHGPYRSGTSIFRLSPLFPNQALNIKNCAIEVEIFDRHWKNKITNTFISKSLVPAPAIVKIFRWIISLISCLLRIPCFTTAVLWWRTTKPGFMSSKSRFLSFTNKTSQMQYLHFSHSMSRTERLDMVILPYCVGLIESLGFKDFGASQSKNIDITLKWSYFWF